MSDPDLPRAVPTIAVVVPVLNGRAMLARCLAALVPQAERAGAVVVVADNGSTDGTPQMLARDFPGVRVVRAAERGCGHARNAALAAVASPAVLFTDADCVVGDGWVEALAGALERSPPDVWCVGGRIEPLRKGTLVERCPSTWVREGAATAVGDGSGPAELSYAATPNAAFRRSAFDRAGAFDGTLGFPDADLGHRLRAAGGRTIYEPRAVVYHQNPATLGELYRHKVKYGRFMSRLARKHPDRFGDPDRAAALARLTVGTAKRVANDAAFKLPRSLIRPASNGHGPEPRLAPLVDAVAAVGNWRGCVSAWRERRP